MQINMKFGIGVKLDDEASQLLRELIGQREGDDNFVEKLLVLAHTLGVTSEARATTEEPTEGSDAPQGATDESAGEQPAEKRPNGKRRGRPPRNRPDEPTTEG